MQFEPRAENANLKLTFRHRRSVNERDDNNCRREKRARARANGNLHAHTFVVIEEMAGQGGEPAPISNGVSVQKRFSISTPLRVVITVAAADTTDANATKTSARQSSLCEGIARKRRAALCLRERRACASRALAAAVLVPAARQKAKEGTVQGKTLLTEEVTC